MPTEANDSFRKSVRKPLPPPPGGRKLSNVGAGSQPPVQRQGTYGVCLPGMQPNQQQMPQASFAAQMPSAQEDYSYDAGDGVYSTPCS